MIYSRISGVGSYLPAQRVTNEDLVGRGLDTSDEWIVERTGIRQRYLAEAGQTSSDLALEASRAAIGSAGIDLQQVDLIIVATSTPDHVFPSTAAYLQAKLGITNGAPAMDVQAVCSGFVYALTVADKFIRSGSHSCALVVGAEVFSRILDWNDRATCVLFGDGAGAVILQACDEPGLRATALHADGRYAEILSVPGNVSGGQVIGSPLLRMDGQAVFKFAVKGLFEVASEVLAASGMAPNQVDWLIPHQANIRILQATAKKIGVPNERVVVTVGEHGNTSAASVPLALDTAVRDGRVRRGQNLLLAGVGGGFTWGAVLLTF